MWMNWLHEQKQASSQSHLEVKKSSAFVLFLFTSFTSSVDPSQNVLYLTMPFKLKTVWKSGSRNMKINQENVSMYAHLARFCLSTVGFVWHVRLGRVWAFKEKVIYRRKTAPELWKKDLWYTTIYASVWSGWRNYLPGKFKESGVGACVSFL